MTLLDDQISSNSFEFINSTKPPNLKKSKVENNHT